MIQKDGQFQFEKDKEATKSYFVDFVNQNTVFFHSLEEKLEYLVDNDYYDKRVLELYGMEEIKDVYKLAYSKKFRFPSFMSAYKFYNDYALKTNDKSRILERYEDRCAIVALTLANGNYDLAKELVELITTQQIQPATPTYLNAGRARGGEMVSCFLLECGDSLNDINMMLSTATQLSKLGGGIGVNLSKIRAKGETIKGVANCTKGVVAVAKLLDNALRYADQQGQRNGAGAGYLNIFHADIVDFLDSKKINADEDVRLKTLSIGVVIPDKFVELAREDKDAYLFYPHTVYKAYGKHLDEMDITNMYEELADHPEVRKDKISARELLEKIAVTRFESGYPYVMFQDNVNNVHANNHLSRVKFSNLCSEILQVSKLSEYTDYGQEDNIGMDISCNLASLQVTNVMENKNIENAVKRAVDALTYVSNATDITNAPAVANANRLMRSIGLGAMDLHGYLAKNKIRYSSPEAREFANTFFMMVNYYSIMRSMELARDTGLTYYGFEDSTYATSEYFDKYLNNSYAPTSEKIYNLFEGMYIPDADDWNYLANQVQEYGLYHSYRLAIAPTGSISYVTSSTAGVLPILERIEQRTYGNSKTYYPMPYLSAQNWFFYQEAYFMDMFDIIDMVATIQQHVDQGISFTIFLTDDKTTRDLTRVDLYAHSKGIKTLYYLRLKDTGIEECVSCAV